MVPYSFMDLFFPIWYSNPIQAKWASGARKEEKGMSTAVPIIRGRERGSASGSLAEGS
jgi:hypothetical protein